MREKLLVQLQRIIEQTIGLKEEANIAIHIQELGVDSKSLVDFTEAISAQLGEAIHPGVFFEYTSLSSFADYLLDTHQNEVENWLNKSASPTAEIQDEANSDPWQSLAASFASEAIQSNDKQILEQAAESMSSAACPVIIGGGISGLLISHQLSKANIHHVVVGKPEISDTPKLGESMTEVVSIEFTRQFEHLSKYFYKKTCTPFFMGDLVAGLRFRFFESLASLFLDDNVPKEFIHVDRIGFDKALYDEVSSSKYCRWVEALVVDVDYDANDDKVQRLTISNDEVLAPSYVWDCTNHIRLLGKAINLAHEEFDQPREVIFTHYYEKAGKHLCERDDLPWMHATSLLSADEDYDQLRGVSWLIPLGSYVSVGISMAPEDIRGRTDEEIIALLTKAYARRGIDYSKEFGRRKEVIRVPSSHFMYERLYGANWALVGGSGSSTWFTSGSNMSIATFMSIIAPNILRNPQEFGEHYARHVRGFAKTQKIYDTFMESNIGMVDALKFLSAIIEQARGRISSYYLKDEAQQIDSAQVAKSLLEDNVLVDKQYLDFLRQIATHSQPAQRQEQAESIFAKFKEMEANDEVVKLPYLRSHNIRDSKPEFFL